MAAVDTFESFVDTLATEDKTKVKDFIREQREQMFAARSEDARTRITYEFIKELRERIKET